MKGLTLRSVLLGSILALGAGCAENANAPTEDPKEDEFSVLPVDSLSSILPAIEDSEGQPDVCVGMIGFAPAEQSAMFDKLTSQITDAANQWNDLLRGNPLWHLKARVQPNYQLQTTECTQTNFAGFSINLWGSVDRFKSEFCGKNRMTDGCSSAAFTSRRTFYLGPWNRTREVDALDGFTVLHEYGHLLGLGDTYRISGKNDFKGEQPPSVMNGEAFSLTDDDKLGLAATLRAVKTGVRSCDGIANKAQFTANVFGALLCNEKAEPITQHDGRPTDPIIAEPPTGPLPDSTLREVTDYTVASLQLNCRAGAGTEHAILQKLVQGTPMRSLRRIARSTEGRPWIQVSVNGQTCFASASLQFVTPQGPIPIATLDEVSDYAVSTLKLNCRSGAGTEFGVIREMPLGTRVTLAADRVAFSVDGNPWLHIQANNHSCYAAANFKFIVPQLQ